MYCLSFMKISAIQFFNALVQSPASKDVRWLHSTDKKSQIFRKSAGNWKINVKSFSIYDKLMSENEKTRFGW